MHVRLPLEPRLLALGVLFVLSHDTAHGFYPGKLATKASRDLPVSQGLEGPQSLAETSVHEATDLVCETTIPHLRHPLLDADL